MKKHRNRNKIYCPLTPKYKKIFKGSEEAFRASWDAQKWLHEHGFSYGSTDGSPYCPIQKGEYTLPQKLYNFDAEDKVQLAGVMKSSNYRNGDVEIWLYEEFEEGGYDKKQALFKPVAMSEAVIAVDTSSLRDYTSIIRISKSVDERTKCTYLPVKSITSKCNMNEDNIIKNGNRGNLKKFPSISSMLGLIQVTIYLLHAVSVWEDRNGFLVRPAWAYAIGCKSRTSPDSGNR